MPNGRARRPRRAAEAGQVNVVHVSSFVRNRKLLNKKAGYGDASCVINVMFGGDGDTLRSYGSDNRMYVVLQVLLTEKLWGTGSGASSLTNLENAINEQCAKGYRLHTISTTSSGSKGWLGGDKIQATMVFESLKLGKQ